MSFKPIRTFLEDRLLDLDNEFEVFDQAFNSEQVGNNDFDKRYHIFYGRVDTTAANHNVTNDSVTANVTLFFRGERTATEALDNAMDFANEYRIECLKRVNYVNLTFIKNVVCNSIVAEPIAESNDNAIKIILEFNISVIFGIGVNLDN
jgi:hypothetical protein